MAEQTCIKCGHHLRQIHAVIYYRSKSATLNFCSGECLIAYFRKEFYRDGAWIFSKYRCKLSITLNDGNTLAFSGQEIITFIRVIQLQLAHQNQRRHDRLKPIHEMKTKLLDQKYSLSQL